MKLRPPSPAMAVALLALVFAMTGSGLAAVTYVRNAGAVDNLSAVPASASNARAAGKLVATQRLGPNRGKLAGRFLPASIQGHGSAQVFGRAQNVIDNGTGVAVPLVTIPGFGTLSATCADQNAKAGVQDPRSIITFSNTSGAAMNWSRNVGNGAASIGVLVANAADNLQINGSNTFQIQLQKGGGDVLVNGVVRQDGKGSSQAQCLVYGQVVSVL